MSSNGTPDHTLDDVVAVVQGHDAFFLGTHVNPDGDGLGSIVAFKLMLENMGKAAVAASRDPIPGYYEFLMGPAPGHIRVTDSFAAEPNAATVIFDCGDRQRVHEGFQVFEHGGPVVNVDHHSSNTRFGTVNYINLDSASTGLMVLDIADALGQPITKDMADAIYTTLITDTGCFRHSNTTARVLEAASRLVEAGAVPHLVVDAVYKNRLLSHLRLKSYVLERAGQSCHDKVMMCNIPLKDFRTISGQLEDFEGIIEELASVKDCEVAALLSVVQEGAVKISMRSRGAVNVAAIAGEMGGGGHPQAAGARVPGKTLAEVERILFGHIEKAVLAAFPGLGTAG